MEAQFNKWEAEVEEAIVANYDNAKKRNPKAVQSPNLAKMNAPVIEKLKKVRLPQGDPTKSNKIQGIAWAPAGSNEETKTMLAFARQDHFVGLIDLQKNLPIAQTTQSKFTQCMAIHPQGKVVLTGGMNNTVELHKMPPAGGNGKMEAGTKWQAHDGYISSIHFLDGGTKYISAAGDADCRIFDLEKGVCVQRLCGHAKDAQSISFAKDDLAQNFFATCSSDKTVRLWDRRQSKCTYVLKTDSELNACCMFPREMSMVACGGEKDKTYLFDIRTCNMVNKYARNNMKTASIAFSSSGRHLYVGHDDGALVVWDIFTSGENKAYQAKIEAHVTFDNQKKPDQTKSRIQEMSLSSDGILATCGFDGGVNLWTAAKAA